jgi:hypothetical protein
MANPPTQIARGLAQLASGQMAAPATATTMAGMLQDVMTRIQASPDVTQYLNDPNGSSRINDLIQAADSWLQTANTATVPAALKPVGTFDEAFPMHRPQ